MIVTDLFQNGTENGMLGHPTRDTFDLMAPICRFLYDNAHCCVVTRDGAFTKVLKDVGMAMKISCLSHRKVKKYPVNSGQSTYCTIGCSILPCEVWLCDFKDMREKGTDKGSLPCITIGESPVPNIESSFLGFTSVEVAINDPKCSRVAGPMRSDQEQPFTKAPEGQVGFEVDIDYHKNGATRMNGHNVITALTCDHMCNNCSIRQEAFMDADGLSACV